MSRYDDDYPEDHSGDSLPFNPQDGMLGLFRRRIPHRDNFLS